MANLANQFQEEKQQMLEQIEEYKQRLASQGNTEALEAELEASKQQLHHMSKEKDFVEKKYLELLEEAEQKPN